MMQSRHSEQSFPDTRASVHFPASIFTKAGSHQGLIPIHQVWQGKPLLVRRGRGHGRKNPRFQLVRTNCETVRTTLPDP